MAMDNVTMELLMYMLLWRCTMLLWICLCTCCYGNGQCYYGVVNVHVAMAMDHCYYGVDVAMVIVASTLVNTSSS